MLIFYTTVFYLLVASERVLSSDVFRDGINLFLKVEYALVISNPDSDIRYEIQRKNAQSSYCYLKRQPAPAVKIFTFAANGTCNHSFRYK